MQHYIGALTILLLLCIVWGRVLLLRRRGIEAMHFGKLDKKDYLIPPFALFYFYLVFAAAFNCPRSPANGSLSPGSFPGRGPSAASRD